MLDQVLAGNKDRLAPFTLAAPHHPLRSGGGPYMAYWQWRALLTYRRPDAWAAGIPEIQSA